MNDHLPTEDQRREIRAALIVVANFAELVDRPGAAAVVRDLARELERLEERVSSVRVRR